jgi:hypothetical protein
MIIPPLRVSLPVGLTGTARQLRRGIHHRFRRTPGIYR